MCSHGAHASDDEKKIRRHATLAEQARSPSILLNFQLLKD